MSKTVTIPTDGGNPFVVILGGIKYVYKPGETVEVPDGVALEIKEWERWHKKYYGDNVPPFGNATDDITAEVGQTIVVKSVDENGKPTEWEAVNFGGAEYANREPDVSVTLTEAVGPHLFFNEVNGNAFNAQKVAILMEFPANTGHIYWHKCTNNKNDINTNHQALSNANYTKPSGIDTKESQFFCIVEKINDKYYTSRALYMCNDSGSVGGITANVAQALFPNNVEGETSIKTIILATGNSATFGVGVKVSIWVD